VKEMPVWLLGKAGPFFMEQGYYKAAREIPLWPTMINGVGTLQFSDAHFLER
jgi:hypothetical protein